MGSVERIGGAYDICLRCMDLGIKCDGPNTLAMTLDRWCEWCRSLKDLRGMTNAQIAEESGVSLATVDRIMSGKSPKDIRRNTAADINRALVGSIGKWPCSKAYEGEVATTIKELELKTAELEGLRRTLEEIHISYSRELDRVRESFTRELDSVRTSYSAELEKVRQEAQAKIDYLKLENERKDKVIDKLLSR